MKNSEDTIIALATPPGVSAIAVLRISGSLVADICRAVLPNFKMRPRFASLANAIDKNGTIIDKPIVLYFPAPNSYTGEDVLELFLHGNPFIARHLTETILKIPGLRLAERGEFAKRAFLNGKIDLTQAEALNDILYARDLKKLGNAHRLLNGEISREIKALAKNIKEVSALLELEADFAEDIELGSENNSLSLRLPCEKIVHLLHHLRNLKSRFKISSNELPRVALFGAPNAGKSSLINALIKDNRLLVSETAGTTRDFVEVPLRLPSGDILLVDTAGLAGEAKSDIDRQAMQKTKDILKKSNLKILAIDVSVPLPNEFEEWVKIADLAVETHCDLPRICSSMQLQNTAIKTIPPKNIGINELRNALDAIFFPKTEETEDIWLTSERQIACIKKAEECVLRALEQLKQADAAELAAFEMREARNAIYSITGEISDDSVLETIFSNYCIGK